MEDWKDIKGYEGLYQISSWGRIKNRKKILSPYVNKKGYLKIGLYKHGVCHKKRINRLVAEAYIPNPNNLPQVNHKDGNKANNSVSNLEWCTNAENREHAECMKKGIYIEITEKRTIYLKNKNDNKLNFTSLIGGRG